MYGKSNVCAIMEFLVFSPRVIVVRPHSRRWVFTHGLDAWCELLWYTMSDKLLTVLRSNGPKVQGKHRNSHEGRGRPYTFEKVGVESKYGKPR